MKMTRSNSRHAIGGFTVGEIMIVLVITTILFAGIVVTSQALNRIYAASNDYFSTHLQQIRIMDYLARDVKRSYSVTTSSDLKTVTCVIPSYTIGSTDPEGVTSSLIGFRRTPVVTGSLGKITVDYGHRVYTDGGFNNGSTILTSSTAAFSAADVGKVVDATVLPAGTTIVSRGSATQVTLSMSATATVSNATFSVQGDGNRTVTDAITTHNSAVLTSATAKFSSADVGRVVVGTAIPAGATITAVTNGTTVTLSTPAVNPLDAGGARISPYTSPVSIGGTIVVYTVAGNSITRSENGVVTMIASSTDSLLPQTTDWQQSNTEYTTTTVTFQPIMTINGTAAQRTGTTVYATAYLRNKRRGN